METHSEKHNSPIQKLMKKCTKKAHFSATVKRPTMQQKLSRNRYQKRSVYYFTHGRDFPEKDAKAKEKESEESSENPYYFPKRFDDFSYRTKYCEYHKAMRENERLYDYMDRPNYQSRLNKGKLERLQLSSDEVEIPGKSVTDNNPEFFTVVAGRPIREKFDRHSYLKDLRELFLIRLETGYKYDETYLMEEQYREEKKSLAEIQKRFNVYSECYEKFLAEDHSSSLQLLKAADEEAKKSKMKKEKIRNLLRDCGWYRTKILVLDDQWKKARIYQKFLYQLSPLWWRNKYDSLKKSKELSEKETSDIFSFGRQASSSVASLPSVITIVDQFIEEISKAEPPQLYFKDPNELLLIFQELEKNNLLALLQCEELTQPAEQMVSGLEKARQLFKQEVNILREHLKSLEEEVVFEENRSHECEQKAKEISLGLFKDLIIDKNTLSLYVNVEDCFEACVAPNDSNLTLRMMMKGIESVQEYLMVCLDKLPNDIVLKSLQTCYKEDAKIMKEAHEASKMIVQIENLMNTLRKSLEPRKEEKKKRKLLWRSEPPVEKMEMPVQQKTLTKEQLDYLYFFTEFCPNLDDPEVGATKCANINI